MTKWINFDLKKPKDGECCIFLKLPFYGHPNGWDCYPDDDIMVISQLGFGNYNSKKKNPFDTPFLVLFWKPFKKPKFSWNDVIKTKEYKRIKEKNNG